MGPPTEDGANESQLNILTVSPGESFIHTNKYLRLPVEESGQLIIESSIDRMEKLREFPRPKSRSDVINMLGDESHKRHRVFCDSADSLVKTIAIGKQDVIVDMKNDYILFI